MKPNRTKIWYPARNESDCSGDPGVHVTVVTESAEEEAETVLVIKRSEEGQTLSKNTQEQGHVPL